VVVFLILVQFPVTDQGKSKIPYYTT